MDTDQAIGIEFWRVVLLVKVPFHKGDIFISKISKVTVHQDRFLAL